jgi:drug/metabolite transporter (DMT)-like permease
VSTAILFGLVSALLFGASDVFARFAGRSTGVIRSIFYGHTMAAVALSVAVLWLGIPQAPGSAWLAQLCANVLSLAATACLYRALTVGRFGVVSPIAATYGGVSALLSLLSGEALSMLGWLGIATTFGGGLLAATPRRSTAAHVASEPAGTGAVLATIAAVLYGVSFWWQGRYSVPALGALIPTWTYYSMGSVFALSWECLRGPKWTRPTSLQLQLALGTSGIACIGSLALAAGQLTGYVAIATLLSALASAVTVLIARAVLKEDVPVHGWIGLALVIAGLVALRIS